MKILDYQDLEYLKDNTAITIGFFDGVHKGHQLIFNKLIEVCKTNNYKSVVITFADDILSLFKMSKNITLLNEKIAILDKFDIDYLLVLKKDDNFMGLSAKEFINKYLNKLNSKAIICGSDFSFAKNKEGNYEYLKKNTDYQIYLVSDYYYNGIKVSSTYIRSLLENGKIKEANNLLYSPFKITSKVITGRQIGRSIGYKTANILSSKQNVLKNGVYKGLVYVDNIPYLSLINVGNNPTVSDSEDIVIEAHLLNFDKDIYNEIIKVEFVDFIRDEIKFESLEKLKEQITLDILKISA